MAFTARVDGLRQVWIRLIGKGKPTQLTRGPREHFFPRWRSADTLVFYRPSESDPFRGELWESDPLASTSPRRLAECSGEADLRWSDGRIASFDEDAEGVSLRLRTIEGQELRRERLERGVYSTPRFAPDGERIAFHRRINLSHSEIRVLDLRTGVSTMAVQGARIRGLSWLRDGSGLVYSSAEGSTMPYPPTYGLWMCRLDDGTTRRLPCGEDGLSSYVHPETMGDGSLVVSREWLRSDLYRYPIDGASPAENQARELRITRQTGNVQTPSADPEGSRVVYLWDSGGHANLWVVAVDGSEEPVQITFEQDPGLVLGVPSWSPEGDWIVYYRQRAGGSAEQWLIRPDGSENHFLTTTIGGAVWAPDGRSIYHMELGTPGDPEVRTVRTEIETGASLAILDGAAGLMVTRDGERGFFTQSGILDPSTLYVVDPLSSRSPRTFVEGFAHRMPFWPTQFSLSPDDRWLAVPLRDEGTTNLWLFSTADGAPKQVTDFGRRSTLIARQVSFARDARHLFAAVQEIDSDLMLLAGALP